VALEADKEAAKSRRRRDALRAALWEAREAKLAERFFAPPPPPPMATSEAASAEILGSSSGGGAVSPASRAKADFWERMEDVGADARLAQFEAEKAAARARRDNLRAERRKLAALRRRAADAKARLAAFEAVARRAKRRRSVLRALLAAAKVINQIHVLKIYIFLKILKI